MRANLSLPGQPTTHSTPRPRPGVRALAALITLTMAILSAPRALLAGPVDELVAQVTASSYQHFLDDMLFTHDGNNRGYGADHDPARQNIFDHFESLGLETSLFPFQYNGNTYYNVVGVHRGFLRPDEIYIVGSHYDSVNNPGADDNGSGTAGVMEAARVLASHRFEATIVFICFDREEQGLKGSQAYAVAHANDDIRGMISADMIAFNPNGVNRAAVYGSTNSNPCKQALADCLTLYGGIEPIQYGAMDRSDHAPFEWQGWQAALLIENEWGSNPNYHHQSDSVDTPNYIDYEFAANMTRSVLGWLALSATPLDAVLTGPTPGIAGQVNAWTISGAAPNTRTYFVYSMTNGSREVPGCPGVVLGMSAPIIAGSSTTDANGDGLFRRFVPGGATGRNIGIQAVQPATCVISNADWHQF